MFGWNCLGGIRIKEMYHYGEYEKSSLTVQLVGHILCYNIRKNKRKGE